MIIENAITQYMNYHRMNSTKSTLRNYNLILCSLERFFKKREIESINTNEIYQFLESSTSKCRQSTKHMRFTQLKAFFNFCIKELNVNMQNPCNTPLLNKTYRLYKAGLRTTITKELIDEIIYRTTKIRDRLLLELQARSGMRIGEVLNLCPRNIDSRKITIESPKSGRDFEFAFLPSSVAERLNSYIIKNQIQADQRIFNLTYSGARNIVKHASERLRIELRPHDLRRYSATYASRSGVPLEVVSKIILRHQDLKTTQIYLGKITENEALYWVDSLHNK